MTRVFSGDGGPDYSDTAGGNTRAWDDAVEIAEGWASEYDRMRHQKDAILAQQREAQQAEVARLQNIMIEAARELRETADGCYHWTSLIATMYDVANQLDIGGQGKGEGAEG